MTKYGSSSKTGLLSVVLCLNAFFFLLRPMQARADEFRQHYEHAVKLYHSGEFEDSIKEFQAAYTIKQLPKLLLNIGQAHRKLGHARDALGFYEFYLRVEPDPKPEIKIELERYIVQTRAMLAAAEKMKAQQSGSPPEPLEEKPAERERVPSGGSPGSAVLGNNLIPAEPASATAAAASASSPEPVPPARDDRPITKKKWFWGVVGGGAAVVTAAVVVGAVLGTRDGSAGNTLPEVRF